MKKNTERNSEIKMCELKNSVRLSGKIVKGCQKRPQSTLPSQGEIVQGHILWSSHPGILVLAM